MADLLAEYSLRLTVRSKVLVQLLHIKTVDNLKQKEQNKYFETCTTSILNTMVTTINTKVAKTYIVLRKSTIKILKKLKLI